VIRGLLKGVNRDGNFLPSPPALETSAARVPLAVPIMGALMMRGVLAWGKSSLSFIFAVANYLGDYVSYCDSSVGW
jgi:hypothetical protein